MDKLPRRVGICKRGLLELVKGKGEEERGQEKGVRTASDSCEMHTEEVEIPATHTAARDVELAGVVRTAELRDLPQLRGRFAAVQVYPLFVLQKKGKIKYVHEIGKT